MLKHWIAYFYTLIISKYYCLNRCKKL